MDTKLSRVIYEQLETLLEAPRDLSYFERALAAVNEAILDSSETKLDLEAIARHAFTVACFSYSVLVPLLRPFNVYPIDRALEYFVVEYLEQNDCLAPGDLLATFLLIRGAFNWGPKPRPPAALEVEQLFKVFIRRFERRIAELEHQPALFQSRLQSYSIYEPALSGLVGKYIGANPAAEHYVDDIDDLIASSLDLSIDIEPEDAQHTLLYISPLRDAYIIPLSLYETSQWLRKRRPSQHYTELVIRPRSTETGYAADEYETTEFFYGKGRGETLRKKLMFDLDQIKLWSTAT